MSKPDVLKTGEFDSLPGPPGQRTETAPTAQETPTVEVPPALPRSLPPFPTLAPEGSHHLQDLPTPEHEAATQLDLTSHPATEGESLYTDLTSTLVLPTNWLMEPETATIETLWSALVLLGQSDDMLRRQAALVLLHLNPPTEATLDLLPKGFDDPRDFLTSFAMAALLNDTVGTTFEHAELLTTASIEQLDDDQVRLAVATLARHMLSHSAIGPQTSRLNLAVVALRKRLSEWLRQIASEEATEQRLEERLQELLNPALPTINLIQTQLASSATGWSLQELIDALWEARSMPEPPPPPIIPFRGGFSLDLEYEDDGFGGYDGDYDFDEVMWSEEPTGDLPIIAGDEDRAPVVVEEDRLDAYIEGTIGGLHLEDDGEYKEIPLGAAADFDFDDVLEVEAEVEGMDVTKDVFDAEETLDYLYGQEQGYDGLKADEAEEDLRESTSIPILQKLKQEEPAEEERKAGKTAKGRAAPSKAKKKAAVRLERSESTLEEEKTRDKDLGIDATGRRRAAAPSEQAQPASEPAPSPAPAPASTPMPSKPVPMPSNAAAPQPKPSRSAGRVPPGAPGAPPPPAQAAMPPPAPPRPAPPPQAPGAPPAPEIPMPKLPAPEMPEPSVEEATEATLPPMPELAGSIAPPEGATEAPTDDRLARADEGPPFQPSAPEPELEERGGEGMREQARPTEAGGGSWKDIQQAIEQAKEQAEAKKAAEAERITSSEMLPPQSSIEYPVSEPWGPEPDGAGQAPPAPSGAPQAEYAPVAKRSGGIATIFKWLLLAPLALVAAPFYGLYWLGKKTWQGFTWLFAKGRKKLEDRAQERGVRVFELMLSEDATKPGPIERSIAQSKAVMRKLQVAFGLKIVVWLCTIDAILEMITEYAHKVLKTWQSLKAKGKKFLRQRNRTLHQSQADDVMLARLQLARLLGLPGFLPEKNITAIDNPELQMKLNDPTFPLELTLELRGLLDELKRDVATLPKVKIDIMKTVQESVKGSLVSTLLPLIPNPFAFLRSWKDLIVMSIYMHYSREEVEVLYARFLDHYQTTIKMSLEAAAEAEKEAGVELPPETVTPEHLALFDFERKLLERLDHPRDALLQNPDIDVKNASEMTKHSLQRLVQALCFPHRIVSLKYRSKVELLKEFQHADELHQIHPRIALAVEEWLTDKVRGKLGKLMETLDEGYTHLSTGQLATNHDTIPDAQQNEAALQLEEARWLRKRKQILRKIEDNIGPWS